MASGTITHAPNKWINITSDCTWNSTYFNSYSAFYNPICKLVLVSMSVKSGVPNQQKIATLSKSVVEMVYNFVNHDVQNNRRQNLVVYPSTDSTRANSIVTSYSLTGNSALAFGATLLIPVSD